METDIICIGLKNVHLTTTSWDYMFYTISKRVGAYVLILFRDSNNTTIYGFFRPNSFVSEYIVSATDIYREKVYVDEKFEKAIDSGILIFKEDIISFQYCNLQDG